jgi:hypothetical protein
MLCLDHVFENGSRDRRVGRGQGVKFLQALKVEGWPPDIQILCYNCNTAKSRLGKCRTRTRLFRRAHWLW